MRIIRISQKLKLKIRQRQGQIQDMEAERQVTSQKLKNGYKGKQVTVKIPDGRIFIVNYIENNGNIYHISQEGLPEYQEELKKVIDTWLPNE